MTAQARHFAPVLAAGLAAALPGPMFLALAGGWPAGWLTPLIVVAQAAGPAILSPVWIALLATRRTRPAVATAVAWGLLCSAAVIYGFSRTH